MTGMVIPAESHPREPGHGRRWWGDVPGVASGSPRGLLGSGYHCCAERAERRSGPLINAAPHLYIRRRE